MGHIRVVEQVAIVDWDPGRLPEVVGELRSHIEGNHGRAVLLNLAKADLRADELETLVEATTVCRDRSSPVAIYGASQDLERLLELLGLDAELPPVLVSREDEALAAIKKDGANVRAPAKPVRAAPPAPVPSPLPPPVPAALDSIPAPLRELATAVTERFDPISDVAEVGPPSALRAAAQPSDDLLAINWADLARTGYQIGGPGGDKLRGEAARGAPTPARAKRPEDDVIDLDEPRGKKPPRPFQKTEVLPAFKVEEGSSPDAGWSAQPGKTPAALVPAALDDEPPTGDYSPVDTGAGAPPAFLAAAPPAAVSPQPTKRPAAPPPKPVEAARPPAAKPPAAKPPAAKPPAAKPPAQPPVRPAAAAAASTPYYDPGSDDGDEQTVMFQATVPVPGQQVYPQTDGAFADSDDQMVMFQPGAQDMALLAQMAQQASAPPEAPAETTDEDEGLSQDETIMFQPGALDAALLAEVAAAAGPETHIPPPPVADPPEPEQPALQLPDARELEVRLFMHDYALSSEQHLSLLDRFLRAGDETVAPQDLTGNGERPSGNGAAGATLAIVDQFVHSRLVRRTRSPRARGGTGFVFSPSPQVRGLAVRLVKMWQTSSSQARVGAWLAEERA